MTSGIGTLSVAERMTCESCSTVSALSARTRHTARRDGTMLSGS
jgi:hypothetical protein